jgi:hypothetical protein
METCWWQTSWSWLSLFNQNKVFPVTANNKRGILTNAVIIIIIIVYSDAHKFHTGVDNDIFVEAVGRHILMVLEEQLVRIWKMVLCQYKMPLFQYEDLYYLPMLNVAVGFSIAIRQRQFSLFFRWPFFWGKLATVGDLLHHWLAPSNDWLLCRHSL